MRLVLVFLVGALALAGCSNASSPSSSASAVSSSALPSAPAAMPSANAPFTWPQDMPSCSEPQPEPRPGVFVGDLPMDPARLAEAVADRRQQRPGIPGEVSQRPGGQDPSHGTVRRRVRSRAQRPGRLWYRARDGRQGCSVC